MIGGVVLVLLLVLVLLSLLNDHWLDNTSVLPDRNTNKHNKYNTHIQSHAAQYVINVKHTIVIIMVHIDSSCSSDTLSTQGLHITQIFTIQTIEGVQVRK